MNQHVIGIIGEIAAGKDTAAAYIAQKTKMPIYAVSDFLKEIAREQNIPIDRDNLIKLAIQLTHEHDAGYLAKVFCEKVRTFALLTGMRQAGQLEYLREHTQFFLIAITADPHLRFERTQARKKAGDGLTYAKFIEQQQGDSRNTIQNFDACLKMTDVVIENNASQEELFHKLDQVLANRDFSQYYG